MRGTGLGKGLGSGFWMSSRILSSYRSNANRRSFPIRLSFTNWKPSLSWYQRAAEEESGVDRAISEPETWCMTADCDPRDFPQPKDPTVGIQTVRRVRD